MRIPKPLLDDITMGRCLPFVGAGFSLNCKAPPGVKISDLKGLARILAEEGDIDSKLSPPKIASLYERRFGRVQLIESVRRALCIDQIEPGDVHRSFASISFETVYTTNFDLLLETAYQETKRPFRSLVGELQMPFHGGPLTTNIVKMHGDLRHEEHIIITEEDYDRYLEEYPVIATHLSSMLITRTALYIGYSLSDPDFQHIREVVRSRLARFERMAYIVQFDATPKKSEKMLKQNLHPINLKAKGKKGRTAVLAEFFRKIQTHMETQTASRMRELRPEAFEPLKKDVLASSLLVSDSAALLTSSSSLCFVLIPSKTEYEPIYWQLIKPAAETFDLKVLRADDVYSPGVMAEQIRAAIHQSSICIADISERNPNVLYGVAMAQALDKSIVLLARDVEQIPHDLRGLQVIFYTIENRGIDRAREHLEVTLRQILLVGRLVGANKALQQGDTISTIALASTFLEQALRDLVHRHEARITDVLRDRKPERLGMGELLGLLSRSKVISRNDFRKIRNCIEIRNNVVHGLEEPTMQEAGEFTRSVSDFVQKYLEEDLST